MEKIKLGKTNEKVSIFALGTMYFGTSTPYGISYAILDRYAERGGSFIDTANIYSWWRDGKGRDSEKLIGKWMEARNNRNEMFIATKLGFEVSGTDIKGGLSAKQIESECEKSLKEMKIETIDLLYAHIDDRNTPLEETLDAFHKLIEKGKVRYIGVSNYISWRLANANLLAELNNLSQFCCVQQKFTYLRPHNGASFSPQVFLNDEMIDYCQEKQITIIGYSPLLKGAYTRSDREIPSQFYGLDTDFRLTTLRNIAMEHNATLNQIVLAWMIQSQPIIIPVIASSSIKQIEENLDSLEISLNYEEMFHLDTAGNPE